MTKNIHLRALRGAVRGVRKPGHKMTVAERQEAARRAKEAEGSEAYRLLETGQKLTMPSAEEQRRMRKKYAMQYSALSQDPDTRRHLFDLSGKLRPERRESLLGHVEAVSRSKGSAMIPERLRRLRETEKQLKGRETLALVNGEWFYVNHVRRSYLEIPDRILIPCQCATTMPGCQARPAALAGQIRRPAGSS